MQFRINKCFEIVTEESAAEGDYAEAGFEFQDRIFTLSELISELEEYSELSYSGIPNSDTWASSEAEQDYRTGEYTSYSLHIKTAEGNDVPQWLICGIYRAAGLYSGNRH